MLTVKFYKTTFGKEPVREWLLTLSREDRKSNGVDLKTVEFGWPIGMPICWPLGQGLYEVRSHLSSNKIPRIFFAFRSNEMVLLHAFIKKTQKIPDVEMNLVHKRLRKLKDDK